MIRGDRRALSSVLLSAAALFAVVECVLSLAWRLQHDTPLLHYAAFLVHRFGRIPYAEVFETSMPGSLLFHLAVVSWFGTSDIAFRLVDLTWLACLAYSTWRLGRPYGKRYAVGAALTFVLLYLSFGPELSLQRDYLGILPISVAVALRLERRAAPFFVGLLFGAAASVKPHLGIGLPVLLLTTSSSGRRLRELLFAFAGCAVLPSACLIWLAMTGAFPAFVELVTTYLPLHVALSGDWIARSGLEKLKYTVDRFLLLGERPLLLVPIAAGAYAAVLRSPPELTERSRTFLLLLATYAVYPLISGQFWNYHWTPFFYFAALVAMLSFNGHGKQLPWAALVSAGLCLALSVRPSSDMRRQLRGMPPSAPEGGRADAIARFLTERTAPGEAVQVIDWAGGGIHALLLAERPLATSFLYDYHFFHHTSSPVIIGLRKRFIAELQTGRPAFIIEVVEGKGAVKGAPEFTELRELLRRDYLATNVEAGFRVHELRSGPAEPALSH